MKDKENYQLLFMWLSEVYKSGALDGMCYLSSHEVIVMVGLQEAWATSVGMHPLGKVRHLLPRGWERRNKVQAFHGAIALWSD